MALPNASRLTLVVFLSLLGAASCDNKYENTKDLCERCKCVARSTTFFLDCTAQHIKWALANWPDQTVPPNITRIVAHFNKNDVEHLGPLPETRKELIVSYARNQIDQLETGLFVNCINVTSLDLSYNKIRSDVLITDVFRGLYNNERYEPLALKTLDLAHNQLHTIGKNVFEHLAALRSLDLSGNNFRVVDQLTYLSFQNLGKLEYLNMANNRLIHLNNTEFNALKKLRILDLSENDLHFIPDAVKDVKDTLRSLRIGSNPIVEISEADLLGMNVLVEILASNLSQLVEVKPDAFATLKNLQTIDLSAIASHVLISDAIFGDSLRELNLSNSNLELLPTRMLNWSQLEVLDLRGNQLYCTCNLHNVTEQLQAAVRRDQAYAYCFDYKRYRQYKVSDLTEGVCFEHDQYLGAYANMASTERILRMILLSTSILLIVCLVVAGWLGYVKCFRNQRNYNFAVSYGPIPHTRIS